MRILALLGLLVFSFACETSNNHSENTDNLNYSLEIIDSIQINKIIGAHSIIATHPENGNLLIISKEGNNDLVIVVSQEGEILKEFEHTSEGPSSAGIVLISATFFEDGYALMGVGNIVTYDEDFNVKKRIKIPLNLGGILASRSKFLRVIEKDERPHFLIFYGPDTDKKSTEEEYYNEYNLLTLVDPENETLEPYAQFPEGSMFKSGKAYHFVRTLFEPSGSQTKAIIANDTTLYTFDNTGNEINRTVIPFDDFVILKGFSMGPQGMEELTKSSEVSGSASGLLQSEGFDVITYRSGIKPERMEQFRNLNGEGYDRAAMNEANPQKIIILKDGKLVSNVSFLPEKISSLSASDLNGNIWATQNVNALDKEPEVVTIYKLRIIEN